MWAVRYPILWVLLVVAHRAVAGGAHQHSRSALDWILPFPQFVGRLWAPQGRALHRCECILATASFSL